MDKKLGGIGASEIGKLFTRDGMASKGVKTLCVEKCEEILNGEKPRINTVAMLHGLFNEEEAYNSVVKVFYPSARYRSSESVWIDSNCWATPDITDEENSLVIDVKCPYTVSSFYKNLNNLPSSYMYQVQMQMLAMGYDNGMICLYLTSNRVDGFGNKIEYEIDINDRHSFITILKDEAIQKEIPHRVGVFVGMRDTLMVDLLNAIEVNDSEFFYIHKEKKITRLKDKSNPFTWGGQIVRNGGIHYVAEDS